MVRETGAAGVRGAETSEFAKCFHIGMFSQTNDCLSLLAGLSMSKEDTYPSPSHSGSDRGRETRESPEILSKFKYCVNASLLMLASFVCCVCVCVHA